MTDAASAIDLLREMDDAPVADQLIWDSRIGWRVRDWQRVTSYYILTNITTDEAPMTVSLEERPMRAIICSDCGQPTGDYSQTTRSGLCPGCQPTSSEAWHRNRAGIFAPQDGGIQFTEDADEDDEDDEPRPGACRQCGFTEFTLRTVATERHDRSYRSGVNEDGELFFYSGDYNDSDYDETVDEEPRGVECDSCGAAYTGDWEWS